MEDWQFGGFGIYLHWPFCQSKCPYCDFNSHVADRIDQDRWRAAYGSEIDRLARATQGRVLNSIYLGGGTPSLMSADLVAAILGRIRDNWTLANDIEVTIEANPGSVEVSRFAGYREAGVNRVSLGVQALDDADLRRLGRVHSVSDALRGLEIAKSVFDRVNFDLIYARQDQTLAAWEQELHRALDLAGDHLSLYQLTIEEGTVFAERFERGKLAGLPSEDLAADFYNLTQEITSAAGFVGYEVSNYAKSDAYSRHNLIYWRGGDYIGIGPGAHGRLTLNGRRHATEGHKAPGAWLHSVENRGDGESVMDALTEEDRALEYLMMSLRLSEGTSISRLNLMDPRLPNPAHLADLVQSGHVSLSSDQIMTTPGGRLVLNQIIERLSRT
jgi:putative oxygen-independent coproporphyrinogen III oxidase